MLAGWSGGNRHWGGARCTHGPRAGPSVAVVWVVAATLGVVCVRIDPTVFAVFDAARAPRERVEAALAWDVVDEPPLAWEGAIFDWASGEWVMVPDLARPVAAALAQAGLPVDLLAWALDGWAWALLVCLLRPAPELAELLPAPAYLEHAGLCLRGSTTPWLPAAVAILAALGT